MIPARIAPSPYLLTSSVRNTEKRRVAMRTYLVAMKSAIILKISVSVFGVSSNPGVSIRVTSLPSIVNSFVSRTSSVHDPKPVESDRFEPLARLINWGQPHEFPVAVTSISCLQLISRFRLRPSLYGNN